MYDLAFPTKTIHVMCPNSFRFDRIYLNHFTQNNGTMCHTKKLWAPYKTLQSSL